MKIVWVPLDVLAREDGSLTFAPYLAMAGESFDLFLIS
jgi:hypothetical protein